MDNIQLKEILHKKIDNIQDLVSLENINASVNEEILEHAHEWIPNPEVLSLVNERREELLSGKVKGMSLEELDQKVRKRYGL